MHRLQELVRLHRLGTGAREAARLLGLGPNTERRYREALAAAGVLGGPPESIPALEELKAAVLRHAPPAVPHQQQSSLASLQERIAALHVRGLGPTAIYDRDQRTETWISLHQQAFQVFGGVPHTVVPDNLKAAVIHDRGSTLPNGTTSSPSASLSSFLSLGTSS